MNEIIKSLFNDALSVKGVPTGTVNAAISNLINKRHRELKEIIMRDIRQGDFGNVDKDELISIFFRLILDAEEGVARKNLELLANIMHRMAIEKKLKAPTFLKYASILSSLTEEEIIVLGVMARNRHTPSKELKEYQEYCIESPNEIKQALLRTGLVVISINSNYELVNPDNLQKNHYKSKVKSSIVYELTSLTDEILRYTNFK